MEEDRSNQLIAAVATILVLSTIFLALRLYARVLTTAERGWDEFILPVAWILVVGTCAIDIGKSSNQVRIAPNADAN